MAERRGARGVKEKSRVRSLEESLDGTTSEISKAERPVDPTDSAPPETSSVRPAPPPNPTIDLAASQRALEERQGRWIMFREEWLRRRAARRTPTAEPSQTEKGPAP
jgi:hypothetical protein